MLCQPGGSFWAEIWRMSEPPFRRRDLKGPYDKTTSVAIPIALTVSSIYLIVSQFVYMQNPLHMINE
ncbi:hypothetical protein L6164_004738 [Bauhinia variegata]|uniref:Uncharacterized protein n=1 Tax=Bauhinia variegata TaxID=167791 RepID=A0ACB9PR38_BAUVA|nr:hypothetical protein L6164_004738 [Bauhinia variegata]